MAIDAAKLIGAAAATETGKAAGAGGQDRFLKLLVAQMQNQDPLNPLDNAQVTSQLAQISAASGIEKLNATLQALTESFAQTQSLQAASLVGRDVLVEGAALTLAGGQAAGGFSLAEAADLVTVTVKDAAGNAVHVATLGPQQAGVHAFAWDGARDSGGSAADGAYSVSINAQRAGSAVQAQPLSVGRVLGVSQNSGAIALDIAGLGRQPYTAVKQVL